MKEINDQKIFPFSLRLKNTNIFTSRQNDIVKSIIKGEQNQDIAKKYGISRNTVKNHKSGNEQVSGERTRLGIYGLIKKETGKRPYFDTELIKLLIESGIVEIVKTI